MQTESAPHTLIPTGPATALLPVAHGKPITVIGTEAIRGTFDQKCLQQAVNSRTAPGVSDLVLNPDAHVGYGAPVGCVMVSPDHIYPGPVGVDIKCSMSLLQLNIPADELSAPSLRRKLIEAILERIPTGPGRGQFEAKKSRRVSPELGREICVNGATENVCRALGIPPQWASRCEDALHLGHDDTPDALANRLEMLISTGQLTNFDKKVRQLGSYGGGNHFGECESVRIHDSPQAKTCAQVFGLLDGHIAFLSHCGSRGFGNALAQGQFRTLQAFFEKWNIPLPGADRELVYAPLGTSQADDYIDDMSLGANFATLNHLLINALALEAFQEVLPGAKGELVYFISHNIARREIVDNRPSWVHRKGATRAMPAGHFSLSGTPFEQTGHPILLPGYPKSGSAVMVATPGAVKSCYSVNHGAGRCLGRREAARRLNQQQIDQEMAEADILSNCRQYPIDEAPAAYKDFDEVLKSVEQADLAEPVAHLSARFVIKDAEKADD